MAWTLLAVLLLILPLRSYAQQDYVGQWDIYNGFAYFDSPDIHLNERGYHLQLGYNAKTWLAIGFDYSVVTGNLTITPDLLKPSLQAQIATSLGPLVQAGVIPPTFSPALPTGSTTETFALGPQLEYRHFRWVTLFARPSIGAIREVATLQSSNPILAGIANALAPGGKKTEWKPFYGIGGGLEVNVARHLSLRMQADYVHNNLFTDILKSGRNTTRLSVGPAIHLGKNIAE